MQWAFAMFPRRDLKHEESKVGSMALNSMGCGVRLPQSQTASGFLQPRGNYSLFLLDML